MSTDEEKLNNLESQQTSRRNEEVYVLTGNVRNC